MKAKNNMIDICILIFTIALTIVFVRRRMIIQDMILQEQKVKIDTLAKIDVNKYSLEEIEGIVKAIQTPPGPPPQRTLDTLADTNVNINWGESLLFVPFGTSEAELNKLAIMYPGIRIIVLDEGEVIGESLLERSKTSF